MDRVGRQAAAIRAERAAAAAQDTERRQEAARLERERQTTERHRQVRMREILSMPERQRRWLLLPADRRILREVREMEWYGEAGARLDELIDTFRQWAIENEIPTNVAVDHRRQSSQLRYGETAPDPLTGGWVIYSYTRTWYEDVTPAWDRFPRSEARSSTQHFFIPREMQSQKSYYGDKTLNNLRVTPFGPDAEGMYNGGINPQAATLPATLNGLAIDRVDRMERELERGMALWVADYPDAPWTV